MALSFIVIWRFFVFFGVNSRNFVKFLVPSSAVSQSYLKARWPKLVKNRAVVIFFTKSMAKL